MGRPLTALRSEPLEDRPLTNPTTGMAACCARAASGHATLHRQAG